ALQSVMISSTLASNTLEDIAQQAGPQRWFQLYLQPQRKITLDLLRRAEAAGYTAIVLTLDASIQIPSQRALRAQFCMPQHCVAANLTGYEPAPTDTLSHNESRIFQGVMRHAPTQNDIEWLLTQTHLPVWFKGVLHPEDACLLQSLGAQGLVVSNHGGRTLDGAPASLTMLPAIRQAVGCDYPLLFDGGIRSGADIFKAIALGADAILIGRLQLYALSVAGALGVAHMIRTLHEELEATMALAGCATLHDIRATKLLRADDIS
ncbi:MAG: alpha-hydroxy acid oxidase, partial [Moraxellaceae bacterium]|nr:alpha-hydroxy acid oxidase [Moraxellaceae bacterium]